MRILVLNAGSLADVVQMLPAFSDAKQALPHIVIDTLVDERWAEVPSWHSAVDKVYALPIKQWRRGFISLMASDELKRLRLQLRKYSYDWVVDLHGNWLSAWFSRSFNANCVGFSRLNNQKQAFSLLYNQRFPADAQLHRVEQIRRLFAQGMNYSLKFPICQYALDSKRFSHAYDESVVLCFGCRHVKRRYPIELGRELIQNLVNSGLRVKLLWRDVQSGDYIKGMSEGIPGVETMPKLKLSGIAAVMVQAKAILTVDNDLSHLAAALETPTICLLSVDSNRQTSAIGSKITQLKIEASNQEDYSPSRLQQLLDELIHQQSSMKFSRHSLAHKNSA